MITRDKKARITGWMVFGAVALILGFIMDLRAFFQFLNEMGLVFLTDPRLWWSLGVVSITTIGIMWVWKQPSNDTLTRMEIAQKLSPRCVQLVALQDELESLITGFIQCQNLNHYTHYVHNKLDTIIPISVKHLFSEQTLKEYYEIVRSASARSKDVRIVVEAAHRYLSSLVLKEILDEVVRKDQANAAT